MSPRAAAALLLGAALLAAAEAPPGAAPAAPAPAPPPAPEGKPRMAVDVARERLDEARRRLARVADYTTRFHTQEYAQGALQPANVMFLKWRRAPRSVYYRFVGKPSPGREVLWRPGWNRDRLRVSTAGFPDLTLDLAPDGWLARRGARHTIRDTGFDHIVELVAGSLARAAGDPAFRADVAAAGRETIFGVPCECFDTTLDKARHPDAYCHRVLLCFDPVRLLPLRVRVWDVEDGALRLVESYDFEDVRLDVGLTDADFDPANPAYDF